MKVGICPMNAASISSSRPYFIRSNCMDRSFSRYRNDGGERGIRTLEGLLTLTPLAGVRLRPLGHLSALLKISAGSAAYVARDLPCSKQDSHDTEAFGGT